MTGGSVATTSRWSGHHHGGRFAGHRRGERGVGEPELLVGVDGGLHAGDLVSRVRQQLKDPASEASSLYNIGVCHKAIGQYIPALQLYQKALALQEPLGNKAVEATTRAGIASTYAALSQPEKARVLYEEVLTLRRASGDKRGEATALSNVSSG